MSPARTTPANWPPNLPYLIRPLLTRALTATPPPYPALSLTASVPAATPSPLVRIRRITTSSHPAHGQHGLFAARALPARSWVVDYLGTYHTRGESDAASDYDIVVDAETGVAVDAARGGNEARFVNDYRGVAERPNVEFGERRENGQARVAVWVGARPVKRGEELVVSYGKGFWEGRRARAEDA